MLEVRRYTFRHTHFDKKCRAANKEYTNIMKKIRFYYKEWRSVKQTKLLELDGSGSMKAMKEELVHFGSRGRKSVSEVDRVEADLLGYLEDCWEKGKRLTRNNIFRTVLE